MAYEQYFIRQHTLYIYRFAHCSFAICGRIIVATFMRHGVGSSLIHGYASSGV
jgi:hypothetical protein